MLWSKGYWTLVALALVLVVGNCSSLLGCLDTLRDEQGNIYYRNWPEVPGKDYAKDEILFRCMHGTLLIPDDSIHAFIEQCAIEPELKHALISSGVYYIERVFVDCRYGDTLKVLDDSTIVKVHDLYDIYLGKIYQGFDVYHSLETLCSTQSILWAEPNTRIEHYDTPNDELFDLQWNLLNLNFGVQCELAWHYETGSQNVEIGICGSGIDVSNPDLTSRVIDGRNYNDDGDYYDWGDDGDIGGDGHETKIAGIIGAKTNNSHIGMAGIAGGWYSLPSEIGPEIFSLRMTDNNGDCWADDFARAIKYGGDYFDCDVLNFSWGTPNWGFLLHDAVAHAQEMRRILVAAMGNSGQDGDARPRYPAQFENNWIISVGAYGSDGIYCTNANCDFYTNYGGKMDVVAPGCNLVATYFGNEYVTNFWGTSGAAPHVTG